MIYAELGSISCGTLRPEDLIPAFVDALDSLREELSAPGATTELPVDTMARASRVGRIDDLLGAIERRMESNGYYESEEAGYDLEKLTEALNEFAPPNAYFGAHWGDGADFGFWPSEDAV